MFEPPGRGGLCHSLVPPDHTMLTLTVRQQKPCCDIYSKLRPLDHNTLPLLIRWTRPHRPPLICHYQYNASHVAWLAIYAHHLPLTFMGADPGK